MHIQIVPDLTTKLTLLAQAASFEQAGDQPMAEARPGRLRPRAPQSRSLSECIEYVSTPRGKKPFLKSMLTTACERNCFYCPFRAGRAKTRRITIGPDELARAFLLMAEARQVEGLFVSSGIIKGSVTTQDKIIDTAEIIRRRHGYRGYLHLKIMPGAEAEQIYRAMQLGDRVSINLESPSHAHLSAIAPKKDFHNELLDRLIGMERIRRAHPDEKLASVVTQFVVGASGDTDLDLLSLSLRLYRQAGLAKVYYSAFHPVSETPLENRAPVSLLRERRLYQASFLLRDYGWEVEELPFLDDGSLDRARDPKRAWADAHLLHAPIDLMTADRHLLLRIPGIGPKTANAIIRARRQRRLNDPALLRGLMRAPEQALPYILLDGRRPPQQLPLL
ncbi:MAG: radical SAM protein [Candidatus Flexifilum sp.]